MSTAYLITLTLNLCAFAITLLLLVLSSFAGDLKQRVFFLFFLNVLFLFAGFVADIFVAFSIGHTGPVIDVLIRAADWFTYSSAGMQFIVFALYFYEYLRTKMSISKMPFNLMILLGAGIIVLSVIASFTNLYARFDEQNNYIRQDTFWISEILPTLSLVVWMGITLRYIKALKAKEWIPLLSYAVAPILCYILEGLYPDLYVSTVGASFSIFLIYMNIQVEMKQQMKLKEAELTESRIAIMLGQIQPHFLYNVLGTIDDLIYADPDMAHRAILDFSNYLRSNMDSLTQKEMILFYKELEHTEQYLRLERLRFNDRLQIEYDIRTDAFTLPVLTLQPLVENAVRYGVTKKRNGGTVLIKTEEAPDCYLITVTDDGVGFDPNSTQPDERSHNGITNVRSRLAAMCGGKLTIQSAIGQGTAAIIEIPKKERK